MNNIIVIDEITFELIEKNIIKDRIYVKVKSNTNADNTTNMVFIIYKSNSQGMWRYFTCQVTGGDCPNKWDDYTTTTMIDFRLQKFVNDKLNDIPIISHKDSRYYVIDEHLDSANSNSETIITFMKNRAVIEPIFDFIWMATKNTFGLMINKDDLYNFNPPKNYLNNVDKRKFTNINKLFCSMLPNKNRISIYDLLGIISNFVRHFFKVDILEPEQVCVFNKNIFNFVNGSIQRTSIPNSMNIDDGLFIKCNDIPPTLNSNAILYPFSTDIQIYKIIINKTKSNIKYALYYMQYKIMGDDVLYKMPLLITPIDTKISKYGMPEKYVRSGIYCNKAWDYKKYAFIDLRIRTITQICRLDIGENEQYIFIGANYNNIWPLAHNTDNTNSSYSVRNINLSFNSNLLTNLINFINY